MMWQTGPLGWSGWLLMALVMLGFWTLVVVGIGAVFRTDRGVGTRARSGSDDPVRLLDARFARGEIDAEEYRARMQALRSSH